MATDPALEDQAWRLLDLATKPDGPRVRLQNDGRTRTLATRSAAAGLMSCYLAPGTSSGPTSPRFDGRCAGCRDRHLSPTQYCLVCDRSGMNDLIAYLLAAEYRREKQARPRVDRGRKAAQVKAELGHARAKGHTPLRGGIG